MDKILENTTVKGSLTITLEGPEGKRTFDFHNLIVSTGKNTIAAALTAVGTPFGWIAIGTGTNAPTIADTALQAEAARVAMSSAGAVNNVSTMNATFPPGVGTAAISEAGIFNANAVGTMLSRVVFPVINKAAADTMIITWSVTIN